MVYFTRALRGLVLFVAGIAACGGGGGGGAPDAAPLPDAAPSFDARPPDAGPVTLDTPECAGETLLATQGVFPMVVSTLQIGAASDGFDLDGDGFKDNKLGGIGQLARESIEEAFERRDLVVPLEMADVPALAADDCVKVAFHVGRYKLDRDGDGATTVLGNDCDDHDAAVARGRAEVAGNGRDDDCDGVADEDGPPDTMDRDGDLVTVAAGDCDDTQTTVGAASELCGDGRDNDCDGVADDGCSPYDDSPDEIALEPLSVEDGKPKILFAAGTLATAGETLQLEAGPNFFAASVPLTLGLTLDLRISGARLAGSLVSMPGGPGLQGARVGGILSASTLDEIRGITVEALNLGPEDSLLDVVFANVLGIALGLPRHDSGCLAPDIDVDADGREGFCDTIGDDGKFQIDLCIDGDGTEIRDGAGGHCTTARTPGGALRFVDGVSVALVFDAVPASKLILTPEP